jgi:IPT/TIG domain
MSKKLLRGLAPVLAMAAIVVVPAAAQAAAPTVTSISPTSGTIKGGTALEIKGTGFKQGAGAEVKATTGVKIVGCAAKEFKVESAELIKATTKECGAGPGEVVVELENKEKSAAGPTYTYTPFITSISPESGPVTGGTPVTIKGVGLEGPTKVKIGKEATEVKEVSSTEATAKTVAAAGSGPDEVILTGTAGTSRKGPIYKYNCAAPACPHIYKNGAKAEEGAKVRTIGWGTVKLLNAFLTEVECHTVAGGYSENPAGGGAAIGQVQAFDTYECVSAGCSSLGGTAIEVTPENLPWSAEGTEPEKGVFRARTGKPAKTPKTIEPGEVVVRVNCVGVTDTQFYGENSPKALNNGLAIGSLPSEGEFDQPGSGELENENIGVGTTEGTGKGEGYGEEELIGVKNP